MANLIKYNEKGMEITFDGTTAWDITDSASSGLPNDAPNGIPISSLKFIPIATDNVLTVREDSATGRRILKETAADAYDARAHYFNQPTVRERMRKLYVKGDEATANVILLIEF